MEHPRLCGVKLHYSHYSHLIWIDPRLRGVKYTEMLGLLFLLGTSPLTRGKGSYYERKCIGHRYTPAYAGKDTKCEKIENVSPGTHQ